MGTADSLFGFSEGMVQGSSGSQPSAENGRRATAEGASLPEV